MENKEKNDDLKVKELEKRQISILRSGNHAAILSVLEDIRENGRITILPEIFELMLDTEDDEIMDGCTGILNDLKAEGAASYLVSGLKNQRYRPIRQQITAACWQSGMDFSHELLLFTKMLVRDDYATALEAFTVIENNVEDSDPAEIGKIRDMINGALPETPDSKKKLLKEMLNVLRQKA